MRNVVHGLDTWLWHRGMHHPQVRVMMRAQLLFCCVCLIVGAIVSPFTMWPLWFAVGACIFANVFWGMARHLLGVTLTAYSSGLLLGVLLRSGFRLLLTAVLLYVALIVCNAPAFALVCGVAANVAVALGTYALVGFVGHN